MKKLFLVLSIYYGISMVLTGHSFACVGARPLAMGGAFIGVADDENATYWNPAGLTQIKDIKLAYTPTIYDRDEVNYDDFVSLVSPLIFNGQDYGNIGFSFVNSGVKEAGGKIIDRWHWLSYGKKLPIDLLDLSVGINLRQRYYKERINAGWGITGTSIIGPDESSDSAMGIDLSLFWRLEKVSLGLLWQDANEPEFDLFGGRMKLKAISNLRPAIAFRPDDKTSFSAELYDVLGESLYTENNLRVGFERWFDLPSQGTSLAVRLGGYNINADSKTDKAVTGGLGVKFGPQVFAQNDIDFPITLGVDYTFMHWLDTSEGISDITHMLGFNISIPFDTLGRISPSFKGENKSTGSLREEIEKTKKDLEREQLAIEKSLKKERLRNNLVSRTKGEEPVKESILEVNMPELKRECYYQQVYEEINSFLSAKTVSIKGSVGLIFTLREDGSVKDIEVSSDDYGLREIVEEVMSDLPYFPQIPAEFGEDEIKFELKITFG